MESQRLSETAKRRGSDGGKMAASKIIEKTDGNGRKQKWTRAKKMQTHLLRHLNEISLVIPFSFLMMEILKFSTLSPTWISKLALVLGRTLCALSTIQLVYTPNNKNNKFTSDLQKRSVRARAFAQSTSLQNYQIPSCDLIQIRVQLSQLSIFSATVRRLGCRVAFNFNESPTAKAHIRIEMKRREKCWFGRARWLSIN